MPEPHRRRVFYSGRVQGVGFRFTCQHIARGFQVSGWVKNLPDGRVELLAEGEKPELEAFLAKVAESMGSNIRSVEQREETATGEFRNFAIAH
jgi:acylphosphatase